jgi:hypothetical protein
MKFFDDGILKDLSAEDLDLLRKEIKALDRQARAELESKERSCSYCGQRVGASLLGSKYCSAWHRYLDGHQSAIQLSRADFERKRALHRIRTVRKATAAKDAENPAGSSTEGITAMRISLRNFKIRQILNEYREITGEGLGQSLRERREAGASEV